MSIAAAKDKRIAARGPRYLRRLVRRFDFGACRRDGFGIGLEINREHHAKGTCEEFFYGPVVYDVTINLTVFAVWCQYGPERPYRAPNAEARNGERRPTSTDTKNHG